MQAQSGGAQQPPWSPGQGGCNGRQPAPSDDQRMRVLGSRWVDPWLRPCVSFVVVRCVLIRGPPCFCWSLALCGCSSTRRFVDEEWRVVDHAPGTGSRARGWMTEGDRLAGQPVSRRVRVPTRPTAPRVRPSAGMASRLLISGSPPEDARGDANDEDGLRWSQPEWQRAVVLSRSLIAECRFWERLRQTSQRPSPGQRRSARPAT